jgi:hypothetical protein
VRDSGFNSLFVKIIGNASTGELQVVWKTNNDRSDVPYNHCMNISHYERYLGHHYFYLSVLARTPDVLPAHQGKKR